jgi:hypothetical protein
MIEGEPSATYIGWFNNAEIATINYGPGVLGGHFHASEEHIGLVQLRAAAASSVLTGYRLLRDEFAGAAPV